MQYKKPIFIIEGPSGVGKDTIINEIIRRYPDKFGKPINACTRKMRENESQGNPYLFLSEEEFLKLRESGEIFEHTIRHGSYRGMRKSSFNEIINNGKIALRDCDKYGLENIKKEYPDKVTGIFLVCDKELIRERLISRNEPEDSMNARLADFDKCIKDKDYFDYIIENINMEDAISDILALIDKLNN